MSGSRKDTPWGEQARGPDREKLRELLARHMLDKGLRSTEQRRIIVDKFFESDDHVTIEELLERVRAVDSGIGYATVYRTLKLLAEASVAHEVQFGDGATRYELAGEDAHHDHLICDDCGLIIEFEEPLIEELQERIAQRYDFTVRRHKHELYGLCKDREACAHRRSHRPSGRSGS